MAYYDPYAVLTVIKLADGRVFYRVRVIRTSLSAHRRYQYRSLYRRGFKVDALSLYTLNCIVTGSENPF